MGPCSCSQLSCGSDVNKQLQPCDDINNPAFSPHLTESHISTPWHVVATPLFTCSVSFNFTFNHFKTLTQPWTVCFSLADATMIFKFHIKKKKALLQSDSNQLRCDPQDAAVSVIVPFVSFWVWPLCWRNKALSDSWSDHVRPSVAVSHCPVKQSTF